MDSIIDIKKLSFSFPKSKLPALDDINIDVKAGEFLAIIGESGSGKTSLCNAIAGLIPNYFVGKYNGNVNVEGINTKDKKLSELSKHVGLVFQNPFNQLSYACNTVVEELAFGMENRGISRIEMIDRIDYIADLVNIRGLLKKSPLSLSGGQLQRVALGCVLVLNPSVLVLDECTSQLDPKATEEILKIIDVLKSRGVTVVMSDNNMENVARFADKILVLKNGRQICFDESKHIFRNIDLVSYGINPPEYISLTKKMCDMGILKDTEYLLGKTVEEINRCLRYED